MEKLSKLEQAYYGKKVFITGITGFKGSWLALILHELGAKVYGLGLKNEYQDSIFEKAHINEFASVFITDIRNHGKMFVPSFIMMNCDYVFHLAAQPLVSVGYNSPVYTIDTNLMGTLYIQEILRKARHTVNYLNVTTDKVYKPLKREHNEEDILQGEDPYSLSKSFSDMLTQMYSRVYFKDTKVSAKIARAGNVIGGGDWCKDRIITDLIKAQQSEQSLHLRCPNSVRPYQYVLDCLVAYLYINAYGKEEIYNVGPTDGSIVTTEELVKSFQRQSDKVKYDTNGESIGKENGFLRLNIDKYSNEFKLKTFAPTIDDVAKHTFLWYDKLNSKKEDMYEVSINQVREVLKYYESQEN